MRIGNATIQIVKALAYENFDFAVVWCENPDGYFPCNIDVWVKALMSSASDIKYDFDGMMRGLNVPRDLVGSGVHKISDISDPAFFTDIQTVYSVSGSSVPSNSVIKQFMQRKNIFFDSFDPSQAYGDFVQTRFVINDETKDSVYIIKVRENNKTPEGYSSNPNKEVYVRFIFTDDNAVKYLSIDLRSGESRMIGVYTNSDGNRSVVVLKNEEEYLEVKPDYVYENLNSCARFCCRTLGYAKERFSVTIRCKKGTLDKAFFEARHISGLKLQVGDGIYDTVNIGGVTWMAENFNSPQGGKWYDNDFNNSMYARLYTFEEAKRLCPSGWHLPTKAEVEMLIKEAGNSPLAIMAKGWKNGTNAVGFNAVGSGFLPAFQNEYQHLNSAFYMWLKENNMWFDVQSAGAAISQFPVRRLSVRYVKDCNLIDTAPRFEGETFVCESFKRVDYPSEIITEEMKTISGNGITSEIIDKFCVNGGWTYESILTANCSAFDILPTEYYRSSSYGVPATPISDYEIKALSYVCTYVAFDSVNSYNFSAFQSKALAFTGCTPTRDKHYFIKTNDYWIYNNYIYGGLGNCFVMFKDSYIFDEATKAKSIEEINGYAGSAKYRWVGDLDVTKKPNDVKGTQGSYMVWDGSAWQGKDLDIVWSYTYPMANVGDNCGQNLMFRDEGGAYHNVPFLWEENKWPAIEDRKRIAKATVVYASSISPDRMKFYLWERGVATKRIGGSDGSDGNNYSNGMPQPTMDAFSTYEGKWNVETPYDGFDTESVSRLWHVFNNARYHRYAHLYMIRIDTGERFWDDTSKKICVNGSVFYGGISFGKHENETYKQDYDGDILVMDDFPGSGRDDYNFVWFKGKCDFKMPLKNVLNGCYAPRIVLDGDITAVDDFLSCGNRSAFLEWVDGGSLDCYRLSIAGLVKNQCSKVMLPDTELVFVGGNSYTAYYDTQKSLTWDDLISVSAKKITFESNLHYGYKLLSPSEWKSGIPSDPGAKLHFMADAKITGNVSGSGEIKATGCSLTFDSIPGTMGHVWYIKHLILENAHIKCLQPKTFVFPHKLEVYGKCSIFHNSRNIAGHWVNDIILHDGSVLDVEILSDVDVVDGTVNIILEGCCELIWNVSNRIKAEISFNGKCLSNPATLRDVQGTLRLAKMDGLPWQNACVINAVVAEKTEPLLNSKTDYEIQFAGLDHKYYTDANISVPYDYWHFDVKAKMLGVFKRIDDYTVTFVLNPESCWDISQYHAMTTERGYIGVLPEKDLDNGTITIRLPQDESYIGKCAVRCSEDDEVEVSPFLAWKALSSELRESWDVDLFKDSRRAELTLYHACGLWIGKREDVPKFEMWFTPDIGNAEEERMDVWVTVDPQAEDCDVLDIKTIFDTNVYTMLRLRLNLAKWPYDIPNGRITVKFMLGNELVTIVKDVRVFSLIEDGVEARFHSHTPANKMILKEAGTVMLDLNNVNSWHDASEKQDAIVILNELEYEDGKPVRGIAEFVPFASEYQGRKWFGERLPLVNERGVITGARVKLKVMGAGAIKIKVKCKDKVFCFQDNGWLCDEATRDNIGKKIDILRWLPLHLRKSGFRGLLEKFEDSLNNCFVDNETNSPIGLLEKIARLKDLRNPDRMDTRFFQDYADMFGIDISAAFSVLENVDEADLYMRNVLKAFSQFQRSKTTLSGFQSLLAMFGAVGSIKYKYSKEYHRTDCSDWTTQPTEGFRMTQHFMVSVLIDKDDMLVFHPAFRQLIDDIKPVTNVFDGWIGYMALPLESENTRIWMSIGSNMKEMAIIVNNEDIVQNNPKEKL